MKTYIQSGLVGDENPVEIDVAILNCLLQDAIFKALVESTGETEGSTGGKVLQNIFCETLTPYAHKEVELK